MQGYYGRDHAAFTAYHAATRERDGFLDWLEEWVFEVPDRDGVPAQGSARGSTALQADTQHGWPRRLITRESTTRPRS